MVLEWSGGPKIVVTGSYGTGKTSITYFVTKVNCQIVLFSLTFCVLLYIRRPFVVVLLCSMAAKYLYINDHAAGQRRVRKIKRDQLKSIRSYCKGFNVG